MLVGAGLLIRTFSQLRQADPGFQPKDALAATISLRDARYETRESVMDLYQRSLTAMRAVPGVEAAGVGLSLPYQRPLNNAIRPAELTGKDDWSMSYLIHATPGYFPALGISLRQGRLFADSDRIDSPPVMLVNQSLVRSHSPDREVLGRRFAVGNLECEVVGVVGDVRQRIGWDAPADATPLVYLPMGQLKGGFRILHTWFSPSWVVRTRLPAEQAFAALRQAMREVDPNLPFASLRTLDDVRAESWSRQRVQAVLLGALASLALLLSAMAAAVGK